MFLHYFVRKNAYFVHFLYTNLKKKKKKKSTNKPNFSFFWPKFSEYSEISQFSAMENSTKSPTGANFSLKAEKTREISVKFRRICDKKILKNRKKNEKKFVRLLLWRKKLQKLMIFDDFYMKK
jgi:hypothetical protein